MKQAHPYFTGHSPQEKADNRLRRRAAHAAIAVAMVLIAVKFVAYVITGSVSVMTSLMDSTFDALASTVTLLGIVHASTPADADHRYGHGKIEALSAMAQALFIFGSAGYLFFEAMRRFVDPQPVQAPAVAVAVMLFSIVATFALMAYQRHVISRTGSVAIAGDMLHYKGDMLMNLSVLVAVCLTYWGNWPYYDPLFAAVISLVILYNACGVAKSSLVILLDRELPDEDRAEIERLVMTHPLVRSMHDLRTRHSGQQAFIEFHLEMDGNITLDRAHAITEEVEAIIYKAFPRAEVLIHQEPAGIVDNRLDVMIAKD